MGVIALVGGLLLAGCAGTVDGSAVLAAPNADPSTRVTEVASTLRQDFEQSPQSINDYWTDEQRGAARPKFEDPVDPGQAQDTPGVEDVASTVVPPTVGPPGAVPPDAIGDDPAGNRYPLPGLSSTTAGKLFFVMDGAPYVCSAAVVSSPNDSTLATAGHCLYDAETHTFNSAFQFVPGFAGGPAGAGVWTLDSAWVDRGYQAAPGWGPQTIRVDFGFARVRPQNGRTIATALGAQGIAFGEVPESILAIGWPAEPPFDGQTPRFCADQTWDRSTRLSYTIRCEMNGGASGGPWLTRYDPASGAGYVIGMSSNSRRGSGFLQGTILGKSALAAYQAAGAP